MECIAQFAGSLAEGDRHAPWSSATFLLAAATRVGGLSDACNTATIMGAWRDEAPAEKPMICWTESNPCRT
ncbi:hypothetical protein BE17_46475 [Sorangium cellulosum]|uniref:Uncharacterized protein n=1 Tax=Sorangium cellulosum TaxID=56 RepID=A0A150R4A6_SORCE|nr:hypothetical protein BE17_46475 [Sorangium cellulosum]